VAGRRPELLSRTLASFGANLIVNFEVGSVFVNIDPIFGDETQHDRTVNVVKDFFPHAEISAPTTPGFCKAVKENWGRTTADFVLHLEDDWLINISVDAGVIEGYFKDHNVSQVMFQSVEKTWDARTNGIYPTLKRRYRIFGFDLPLKYRRPTFTTSPSFLRGTFARQVAALYDVNFDPEKQFSKRVNLPLERYTYRFRSVMHAIDDGFVITDIGREWRDVRGIEKDMRGCVSRWSSFHDRL
jgi:hypothetical protein